MAAAETLYPRTWKQDTLHATVTLTNAVASNIHVIPRRVDGGFFTVTVKGETAANDLDAVTIAVLPLYRDEDGDIQEGTASVDLVTGVDFSAGGVVSGPYSLNTAFSLASDTTKMMHCDGWMVQLTDVGGAGTSGDLTLIVQEKASEAV